jgi:Uma2 family endonuclease
LDPDFVLPEFASRADYDSWPEDVRAEIIDGVVYPLYVDEQGMAAAPLNNHQDLVGEFFAAIHRHLRGKPCRAYLAPFAVQLREEESRTVEPDISVLCDPAKRSERGCLGAPDWIIEVLSPTTIRHDQIVKRRLYEQAGVKEYWVVDPIGRVVYVSRLGADGRYAGAEIYGEPESIEPAAFPGLAIDLSEAFAVLNP